MPLNSHPVAALLSDRTNIPLASARAQEGGPFFSRLFMAKPNCGPAHLDPPELDQAPED